jgi:hypothetical protein
VTAPRTFQDLVDNALSAQLAEVERDTPEPGEPLTVRKLGMWMPVSCCLLTEETGELHCEHPPRVLPPVPWTRRLRYWVGERWRAGRVWLARRIAGGCWPEDDE